jgi:hypothetical protein
MWKYAQKLKIKGELQNYKHQTIPKSNPLKNLCIGILDITYYIVSLLSPWKKTGAHTKIRKNKEEHVRSTWSSLLLTSLLTKGIHAGEIFEYGWYIVFVTHVILAGSMHFLHLLLVFSFQTRQPIQPPLPLACINSLSFYKCPLWDPACVSTATQLTVFSHQWLAYLKWLRCNVPFLQFFLAHFPYVTRIIVGWGTALQHKRFRIRFPAGSLGILQRSIPSVCLQ